jgi:hypothetical protein
VRANVSGLADAAVFDSDRVAGLLECVFNDNVAVAAVAHRRNAGDLVVECESPVISASASASFCVRSSSPGAMCYRSDAFLAVAAPPVVLPTAMLPVCTQGLQCTVSVSGNLFRSGSVCAVPDRVAQTVRVSDVLLLCSFPVSVADADVHVRVKSAEGLLSQVALRVSVVADAVISSVWPSAGPVLGGQHVVIRGADLHVLDETRLSGGVCGAVLQRNSTQLTCLSARSTSAKRTAVALGLSAGGVYEYVGNAGIREVTPSAVSTFGGDVLRVSIQGSGAAVLNSSSYWRCAFVGFDVFSVATILDSGDATCVMPGIRSSIVSSGSVLSLHLVSSEGSVLDGGSVVVIGDVGLVGVTPGLVGTGALFRFLLTGAFSWGFGIRAVDAVCSAGEFVGSLDIVGSDLAACDVELPSSAKGRLPFNVRLTGSNVSLSSVSVDVTAVGTMTTLAVEPSVVSGASLSVVTVHGDGFIRAAALTCRVGKADRHPAVFLSPTAVECSLYTTVPGNITVSVDGSSGSATVLVLETSQMIVSVSPSHGCSDRASIIKVLPSENFLLMNFTLVQLEVAENVVFACAPYNGVAFECKFDPISIVNIRTSFLSFTASRFGVILRSQSSRVLFEFHACPNIIDAKPRLVDKNTLITITGSNFRLSGLHECVVSDVIGASVGVLSARAVVSESGTLFCRFDGNMNRSFTGNLQVFDESLLVTQMHAIQVEIRSQSEEDVFHVHPSEICSGNPISLTISGNFVRNFANIFCVVGGFRVAGFKSSNETVACDILDQLFPPAVQRIFVEADGVILNPGSILSVTILKPMATGALSVQPGILSRNGFTKIRITGSTLQADEMRFESLRFESSVAAKSVSVGIHADFELQLLWAISPSLDVGTWAVFLIGSSCKMECGTVEVVSAIECASIIPSFIASDQKVVTVIGSNFYMMNASKAVCSFGGVLTPASVVSSSVLVCEAPAILNPGSSVELSVSCNGHYQPVAERR